VQLVADQGFTDINVCYSSPRGDDLDTRLLRAMVIKGILEEITTSNVNLVRCGKGARAVREGLAAGGLPWGGVAWEKQQRRGPGPAAPYPLSHPPHLPPHPPKPHPPGQKVNADLLAKGRGLRISEVTVRAEGADVLSSMSVSLGASKSRFSAAVDKTGRIYVEGTVRAGRPYLTKIGG
jgi:hypothetical protein